MTVIPRNANKVNAKVMYILEQAVKAQKGRRCVVLLFL